MWKSEKTYLGNSHIFQVKAEALYQHPERVKLEIAQRKTGDAKSFESFAGPFDITIIKLETQITFNAAVRFLK